MRRWLLVLLVALLPLRGWAAEAMADQMLAQQLGAMESIAAQHHSTRAEGKNHQDHGEAMADCHGQAAAAEPQEPLAGADLCASCLQCQVCSSVALQPATVCLAVFAALPQAPDAGAVRFASAPTALALKPPIA